MVLQYVVTRSGTTGDGCLRQRAEVLVERAGGDVHRIAERSKGVCPKEQNFRPQWYEYNLENNALFFLRIPLRQEWQKLLQRRRRLEPAVRSVCERHVHQDLVNNLWKMLNRK